MISWSFCVLIVLSLIVKSGCDSINGDKTVEGGDIGDGSKEVVEIQQTTCKITTAQLAATAQATVTRALKGVCSAKSIEEQLKRIEISFGEQRDHLQLIMQKLNITTTEGVQNFIHHKRIETPADESVDLISRSKELAEIIDDTASEEIMTVEGPRDAEVQKYNCTVHKDEIRRRIFTYYWKVTQVEDILSAWKIVPGPEVNITPGGYRMKLRLVPVHHGDTLYLRVRLVHGLYDEALVWPFRLKHRLTILDQGEDKKNSQGDIQSRICDPAVQCSEAHWRKPLVSIENYECIGLGIPYSILKNETYVFMDNIIFKLAVYLE